MVSLLISRTAGEDHFVSGDVVSNLKLIVQTPVIEAIILVII